MSEAVTIALSGNPNCGKTTLFNQLTGLRQKVANYPGVTVEKRSGPLDLEEGRRATVVDLPGAYSLISRSREEAIAFEFIVGEGDDDAPALNVVVLDASNLERNLYLALQILELGQPVVVALNMMDRALENGVSWDVASLEKALGVPVVPIVATRGEGMDALLATIRKTLEVPSNARGRAFTLSEAAEHEIRGLAESMRGASDVERDGRAVWSLTSAAAVHEAELDEADKVPELEDPKIGAALSRLGPSILSAVIEARYRVADEVAKSARQSAETKGPPLTDRVDDILLHRLLGPVIFLVVMAMVFQSIFAWADPLIGLIEELFALAGDTLAAVLPEGPIRDLAVEGFVAGVGSVLVFIPQIGILFFFLALLEDCGYLARVAYLMDRIMARVGLSGRAFVPLMSGFACAVPGILATRTIENAKDRLVTILVLPLMSCSARLPVYALIISTLFADGTVFGIISVGAALLLLMYVLSVLVTLVVATVFKRTLLKSPVPALVLELPPYRRPRIRDAVRRAYDRCLVFVRDAGSVILACTIILWVLLSYPKIDVPEGASEAQQAQLSAQQLEQSFAGRLGKAFEPAIEPLGFDWKIGIGLIGSFAAREVLVSTLGLVYGIGQDIDEESVPLREALRRETNPKTGKKVYTPLVGLSLMIFFLLACQCLSTVAVVRRETASWRWPIFMVVYMTALAYIGSLFVYQVGRLLGYA